MKLIKLFDLSNMIKIYPPNVTITIVLFGRAAVVGGGGEAEIPTEGEEADRQVNQLLDILEGQE